MGRFPGWAAALIAGMSAVWFAALVWMLFCGGE